MFTTPYLANVTIFAGNFAPRGWAFCNGQLLDIAQNDALFALIGTIYGGDGINTFALPDLQSRMAIHTGQGVGLSNHWLGEQGGAESVTMLSTQMPSHTHQFVSLTGAPGASGNAGIPGDPTNNVPALLSGINAYNTSGTGKMAPTTNTPNTPIAGGSQPISLGPPTLAMNYIIALEGIFPSRN
jgi:microcystin-dependent protein